MMLAADQEFDLDRRRAATEAIMRELLADPPALLLNEGFRSVAAHPKVTGLEAPLGMIRYEKLGFSAAR
jgi:hypothetical protein